MYTSNPGVSSESSAVLQRFRELLLEISTRLISVDPHGIDDGIDRGLKLTKEFWDSDRTTLAVIADDGILVSNAHISVSSGVNGPSIESSHWKNSFLLEQLCHGEIVALERSGIGESELYLADSIALPAGYPPDVEVKKDHL
jgi:hypothetical protein